MEACWQLHLRKPKHARHTFMVSMTMQNAPTAERVIPPVPQPLPEGLSTRSLIRAYATDVLATYPERSFGQHKKRWASYFMPSMEKEGIRSSHPVSNRETCKTIANSVSDSAARFVA
jgi:hypothetical protein